MKNKILFILIAVILFLMPNVIFGQAPNLGTAANFVLFTTNGAVSNTGISQLTGNVGTNNGSSTAFGNVNGVMHNNNGASAQCAADLLIAYNLLNSTIPTFFPAPLLGNGATINAGVYSIAGGATLNLGLTLDAQGDPNAVFIFQIQGAFSTNAASKIHLKNGAMACNVFWKVEGLVSMASGTTMRGTVIANNAAIIMNTGDTLEGRALSTAGAITVAGVLAYTPIGCGSPYLTGPTGPALASTECYALFSANGPVTNNGVSYVTGDIGTNVGLTTGFNPLYVTGAIHPIPDGSTTACAADLLTVYNYLNILPNDIELLYPAQFGRNLVLTPHTYIMNGAATFTDTLYLNARGNANAVFVIKVNGALSTSTYSKVILINEARSKNVYWMVNGAVSINDYSVFRGTIIGNNGAISLNTGVTLDGRALTTNGAFNTAAIAAIIPSGCNSFSPPVITTQAIAQTKCAGSSVSFSVTATGTGLIYQWRKGTLNLANGGNISGATSAILTLNPVNSSDAASNYNVVVSGTYPPNATSTNVTLVVNPLPVPTITGPTETCSNGEPTIYYTEGGQSNYQWAFSPDVTLVAGGTSATKSITVQWNTLGTQWLSVNYTITETGCTASIPVVLNVNVNIAPEAAGIINGPAVACAGVTGIAYSIGAIANTTSYAWTVPAGATIASGAGTNAITVNYSSTALSGNISVSGTNNCGNGIASTMAVTVDPLPVAAGSINGKTTVCQGEIAVTYLIGPIANATTYEWTVPAGGNIIFGQGTNSIVVDYSLVTESGVVAVNGLNACGEGSKSSLNIVVNLLPATPVITRTNHIFTSNALSGNQWYLDGTLIVGATAQSYDATLSGSYWTVVTLEGCSSAESNKISISFVGISSPATAKFDLSPVPSNGSFIATMWWPTEENFTIRVYNNLGSVVFEKKDVLVNGITKEIIDMQPVLSGLYTVVFTTGINQVVRKMIINR